MDIVDRSHIFTYEITDFLTSFPTVLFYPNYLILYGTDPAQLAGVSIVRYDFSAAVEIVNAEFCAIFV